jgi:hypothetical protein
MTKKYSIFHIEGGLGKHIAATSVAKAIKKNHPDRELIVVCAYPEIFVNLEFIYRVYRHGHTPYFYQDYIKDSDFIIFKHEPYFTTEHIRKEKSLIENWCDLYNLEYSGELPGIEFNYRQLQYSNNLWGRDKPIFLIHTHGGPLDKQPYPYSWTRDMPQYVYKPIVEAFKDTHHIIQVCRDQSQAIDHPQVEVVSQPLLNMEMFGLVQMSDKRLLIDSSLQHAAAALDKKSTVLWIGTSPKVFGYNFHRNIVANLNDDNFKLPDSYLFDYNFTGTLHECPVKDPTTMFDITEIIESFNKTKLV